MSDDERRRRDKQRQKINRLLARLAGSDMPAGEQKVVAWYLRVLRSGKATRERGYAWPSIESLARILSVSMDTVKRARRRMRELAWFEVRTGGGYGCATEVSMRGARRTEHDSDDDNDDDGNEPQFSEEERRTFALNRLAVFQAVSPFTAPGLPWPEIASAPPERLSAFYRLVQAERERVFGLRDDKSALAEGQLIEIWCAAQPEPAESPAPDMRTKEELVTAALKVFGTDKAGAFEALAAVDLSWPRFLLASPDALRTFLAKVTVAEAMFGVRVPRKELARLWLGPQRG